jgi:hypothetical protein
VRDVRAFELAGAADAPALKQDLGEAPEIERKQDRLHHEQRSGAHGQGIDQEQDARQNRCDPERQHRLHRIGATVVAEASQPRPST